MSAGYLQALGLTLLFELPLVVLLAGQEHRRRVWLDGLLLNLFTHPLAVSLHHAIAPEQTYGGVFWLLELAVVATEAAGYRWVTRLSWRRAWLVSGVANGVTALLSLAVYA